MRFVRDFGGRPEFSESIKKAWNNLRIFFNRKSRFLLDFICGYDMKEIVKLGSGFRSENPGFLFLTYSRWCPASARTGGLYQDLTTPTGFLFSGERR